MADEATVKFLDNPHAPELHSTGHSGIWIHAGNVHITFEAGRVDHSASPGPINRVVIGRLVIPMQAATALADHINAIIKNPISGPPEASGTALH